MKLGVTKGWNVYSVLFFWLINERISLPNPWRISKKVAHVFWLTKNRRGNSCHWHCNLSSKTITSQKNTFKKGTGLNLIIWDTRTEILSVRYIYITVHISEPNLFVASRGFSVYFVKKSTSSWQGWHTKFSVILAEKSVWTLGLWPRSKNLII